MEKVQRSRRLSAAVILLSIAVAAELFFLFCSYKEGMMQYQMRGEGYVFVKIGGYDESVGIGNNGRYHQDWLGLERCKILLKKNGHWLFTPEQDKVFRNIELLVVKESESILSLYDQLYNRLDNAQLELFLSSDKVLTPYASAGSEGSDLRTYLGSLSVLRRIAGLENEEVWKKFTDNEKEINNHSKYVAASSPPGQQLEIVLPYLNTSPLSPLQGPGFEDTETRRSLLRRAKELEFHPLRVVIALKELCLVSKNQLSPQQAKDMLVLIERLRISTSRLEALYQNAKSSVPKETWKKMMSYPELQVLEKRIVKELPYTKTINRTIGLIKSSSEAEIYQRRTNPRIPPMKIFNHHPQPGNPPPPPPNANHRD
ncbi:MAG: hypothetical protein ACI38Q_02085 [Candidatus Bruticola sp.]